MYYVIKAYTNSLVVCWVEVTESSPRSDTRQTISSREQELCEHRVPGPTCQNTLQCLDSLDLT